MTSIPTPFICGLSPPLPPGGGVTAQNKSLVTEKRSGEVGILSFARANHLVSYQWELRVSALLFSFRNK